jgi:hypothetical protein
MTGRTLWHRVRAELGPHLVVPREEEIMRDVRVTGQRRRWIIRGAACLCSALAGCGGRDPSGWVHTYEVKGRVLLADGSPLTVGRVYFVPQVAPAVAAQGELGPDGSFALTTYKPGDGAAPGQYKVRVEPTPAGTSAFAPKARLPKVRRKYTDEDLSGLAVAIKPEPNQLSPFRLK